MPFDYKAFISYKHNVSDTFTRRLEQALKSYAKPTFAPPIRIFRDEKHLTPGVDLPQLIIHALDASEFLILLASREAARSPWVAVEIDHWCGQLKRTANLIVILVDGEIATDDISKGVDWAKTDALPIALKPYLDHVPLYVDMRKQVKADDLTLANPEFKTAVNALVARFRGVDPNEMLGEEIHQHRRAIRIRNGGIGALAVLTLASMIAAYVAVTQREEARQQARIAQSRQYAAEATTLMETDLDEAIFRGVRAIGTNDTFEARTILFRAVTHAPAIEAFLHRTGDGERPPVTSFNPTGNELSLAAAGTLHLFTLVDGNAPGSRSVQLPLGAISSLAHSHNGVLVAVGGDDGRVMVLNNADSTPIAAPLTLTDQTVSRVFFGADDKQLFAVSDGKVFRVSVSARELIPAEPVPIRPPELNAPITDWTGKPIGRRRGDLTAVSADGRLLATANVRTIVVWDLTDPIHERLSFDVRHLFTVGVREVALSPRGDMLAVDLLPASDGILASFVQLYSLSGSNGVGESARPVLRSTFTTAKALDTPTYRLAFDAAGNQLLIGDRESRFNLVDVKSASIEANREINLMGTGRLTGARRIEVRGLSGTVHGPQFTADDKKILIGVGTRVVLWNPREPDALSRTLITHDRSPSDIAFTPEGDRLVVATEDGTVLGWKTQQAITRPSTQSVIGEGAGIITREGTQVNLVAGDELSVRDVLTGREVHKTGLENWKRLAVSADGETIAVFRAGMLRVLAGPAFREVWKTQVYEEKQTANPPVRDPGVGFSRDGARMFVHVFGTAELTEWSVTSGRRVDTFDSGVQRAWDWAPVVSPDGRWVVTAASSGSLALVNTMSRTHETLEARSSVCAVRFSPDSARLAIAYESDEEDASDSSDGRFHPADYGVLFWRLIDR